MRTLLISLALTLAAGPALAGPVTLKANPVDADGQVTLGDIFEGAGSASDVMVGRRGGPSIVFEAGELQTLARQNGLEWSNETRLRRVVVRGAAYAPGASGAVEAVSQGQSVVAQAPSPARAAYGDRVISRGDMVEVAYNVGGVRLTVTGRAEGNAAQGQRFAVRNLQSNRVIDAVAAGPGLADAGAAVRARQFASQ